ncbi:LysR family transcriptional regulator [Fodinicola feengrottensis]|uniref:LysR family transcriptional regulator n=1 Tax=Fodinicola feengrottensis TaxID=435914 RepID=UPI002441B715|nr:LysR family transcriptional regulator [Fodinicola feengrottensis]
MDIEAVRTFVAAVDAGQFQEAATDLSITQQAVSKRIAALEKDLGVRLFIRTARGARVTIDGQAFLPHARELLRVEERAIASVRPDRRALRVDVIGQRIAPAGLLRDFHRAHPETELDVVTHVLDTDAAIEAIRSGALGRIHPCRPAARAPAHRRRPSGPGPRRADSPADRSRARVRDRSYDRVERAGRAADLDARDRARHGVGRVLPGVRDRVRRHD